MRVRAVDSLDDVLIGGPLSPVFFKVSRALEAQVSSSSISSSSRDHDAKKSRTCSKKGPTKLENEGPEAPGGAWETSEAPLGRSRGPWEPFWCLQGRPPLTCSWGNRARPEIVRSGLDRPDRPHDQTAKTERTARPDRPDFFDNFVTLGSLRARFSTNFGSISGETVRRPRPRRGDEFGTTFAAVPPVGGSKKQTNPKRRHAWI